MKESMWGYWIVVLGISIMSVMVLLQNYTTTSEQDYFLLKSVLEASMYEAVDYGYYRDTGTLKMNTEKFVENFVRRFSETVNINKTYDLQFYQIYEEPPAASVAVRTITDDTNYGKDATATNSNPDVVNRLTGILYTNSTYESYDAEILTMITSKYTLTVKDNRGNTLFSDNDMPYTEQKLSYNLQANSGDYTRLTCSTSDGTKTVMLSDPVETGTHMFKYNFEITITSNVNCVIS